MHPVRIVGTGLIGTSLGLALRGRGVDVSLTDMSPVALDVAVERGAGRRAAVDDAPEVVVVAVPPAHLASVVARELAQFPDATVTDVCSVKSAPLDALRASVPHLSRYVGGHPMAGRERGGAEWGSADLFTGRTWVVCTDTAATNRIAAVERIVLDVGALPVSMSAEQHDRAVALVSHAPQLVASLLAGRLRGAPESALQLVEPRIRRTLRIAASDPGLWEQILRSNSAALAPLMSELVDRLEIVRAALRAPTDEGRLRLLAETLSAGTDGVRALPTPRETAVRSGWIRIPVVDAPGQLGSVFRALRPRDTDVLDLRLHHSDFSPMGFLDLLLDRAEVGEAMDALRLAGWNPASLED